MNNTRCHLSDKVELGHTHVEQSFHKRDPLRNSSTDEDDGGVSCDAGSRTRHTAQKLTAIEINGGDLYLESHCIFEHLVYGQIERMDLVRVVHLRQTGPGWWRVERVPPVK